MPALLTVLVSALAGAATALPAGSLARERIGAERTGADSVRRHEAAVVDPLPSGARRRRERRRGLPDAVPGGAFSGLVTGGALLAGQDGVPLWRTALLVAPLLVLLTAACWVDLRAHRLPNRLLGAAGVLVVALAVLAGAWSALLVGAGLGLALLLLALARTGLGLGDVKLEAVLGTWLGVWGPWTAVQGLLAGLVIGGAVALALVLAGRADRRTAIALGPSLLAGALLAWAGAVTGRPL